MAVHIATVETLIDKAKFEPNIAIAVAEAMDYTMRESQLVTVSVLDARLADLRRDVELRFKDMDVRFAQLKAELVRWVFVTSLGQIVTLTGIMYFMLQHALDRS